MFTLTSLIFFGLLDLLVSAILIGIGLVVLAIISFLVTGVIKAFLPSKKTKNSDNKQRVKNTFLYEKIT